MEIDPKTLQDRLLARNPPLVLDVRQPHEWAAEGIIEGALLIPMNELPARLAEIPADREVAAVCHRGIRSLNAAVWLRQMGRNVISMSGGMAQWKALGLPTAAAR